MYCRYVRCFLIGVVAAKIVVAVAVVVVVANVVLVVHVVVDLVVLVVVIVVTTVVDTVVHAVVAAVVATRDVVVFAVDVVALLLSMLLLRQWPETNRRLTLNRLLVSR